MASRKWTVVVKTLAEYESYRVREAADNRAKEIQGELRAELDAASKEGMFVEVYREGDRVPVTVLPVREKDRCGG